MSAERVAVTPQMRGRYPGYDVLDEAEHWDQVTRRLVLDRVQRVPPIRFFTAPEALTLGAFCDLVLAQDGEPRIPVLNMVDAKLFAGELDGFRYEDLPDDRETWRRVAAGLDASARQHGAVDFVTAPDDVRGRIVEAFAEAKLRGEIWDDLPPARAWKVVTRGMLSAFYSHPWAWNEIGFGGPAYPRGYARIGAGQRETWERG
jgi:Gluconate 2-dehydrogenase subunit 3